MEDFHRAGGLLSVLREVKDLLDPTALTVTGKPLVDYSTTPQIWDREVISDPLGAARSRRRHRRAVRHARSRGSHHQTAAATTATPHPPWPGRRVRQRRDAHARMDDPDLEVDADSVLVLRGLRTAGISGHAGGLEHAAAQETARTGRTRHGADLRRPDERHRVRHRGAARRSEAAAGGPLALVQTGDYVILDVPNRILDLDVDPDELSRRVPNRATTDGFAAPKRGWERLYIDHVTQADSGADLDFLQGSSGDKVVRESH
jgi:dihydroxy-acid dehydratase